jgi:hypothetical protein
MATANSPIWNKLTLRRQRWSNSSRDAVRDCSGIFRPIYQPVRTRTEFERILQAVGPRRPSARVFCPKMSPNVAFCRLQKKMLHDDPNINLRQIVTGLNTVRGEIPVWWFDNRANPVKVSRSPAYFATERDSWHSPTIPGTMTGIFCSKERGP